MLICPQRINKWRSYKGFDEKEEYYDDNTCVWLIRSVSLLALISVYTIQTLASKQIMEL